MEDEQISGYGIDSDKALLEGSDKKKDFLRRRPFAKRIANLINSLGDDYDDSVVIGIEGEWGVGKTSLINFILEEIHLNDNNIVIEFNPWNFSNQNELIKEFFSLIAEGLNQNYKKRTDWWSRFKNWMSERFGRQSVAKTVGGYMSKLLEHSEIEVSPSASIFAILGFITFRLTGRLKFRRGSDNSLEEQKKKINEHIKDTGKRIVIVIDDIDRLDSDETKLIFKLVRLTASFPYTVFLLAYDRVKVGKRMDERGIDGQDVIKGEEYLKKIIQQPFLVPKPAREDIYGELDRAIDLELKNNGFDKGDVDEPRLRSFTGTLEFREFFKTVRDIRRYINSLRLDLKFLDKIEVNPVDFVVIELIRVFAPGVYLAMTDEKLAFTTPDNLTDHQLKNTYKEIRDKIIKNAPEELRVIIEKIFLQLFPQLRGHIGSETLYKNERRVCSTDFFDKYFLLSIPPHLVSESEIEDFLSAKDDVDILSGKLNKFLEQKKLSPLFEKLSYKLEKLNDQQRKSLLISVCDFVESLGTDFHGQAARLVRQTLEDIEPTERFAFLESIIEEIKEFSAVGMFITASKNFAGASGPLLTKEELDKLDKAYMEKFKKYRKSKIL